MKKYKCLILSANTTGSGLQDQILEVCALGLDGTIILDTLVKPACIVNWGATEEHGIDPSQLEDRPSWGAVAERLFDILGSSEIVCMHKSNFYLRIFEQSCRAHNIIMPSISAACFQEFASDYVVKNLLRPGQARIFRPSLGELCKQLGIACDVETQVRARDKARLVLSALNKAPRILEAIMQRAAAPQKVEASPRVSVVDRLKSHIDASLPMGGVRFRRWIEALKASGVLMDPEFYTRKNQHFRACSFSMGNMRIPASKLGKHYTPASLMKRGLIYSAETDGELLEELFISSSLRLQKSYFQMMADRGDEAYLALLSHKTLTKSVYHVKRISSIGPISIASTYSTEMDQSSPFTQLNPSLSSPSGVLLRCVSINDHAQLHFSYSSHHDRVPQQVSVSMGNTEQLFYGPECVRAATAKLPKALAEALSRCLSGAPDAAITTTKQEFIDAFTGESLGQCQRYANRYVPEGYLLTPEFQKE